MTNYLKNVAIVGAGGNSGRFMTEALLATKMHIVTALTRTDSLSKIPHGTIVKIIDYDKPGSIVDALNGQDCLVITLSGHSAIDELELKLVRAAATAKVSWVLRNEWGPDTANQDLVKDVSVFQSKVMNLEAIRGVKGISSIAICTGFWYEWSLAMAPAFGFDFKRGAVTIFDAGDVKICVSTWHQIGRAVAALLSLPVEKAARGETCLADLRNETVYINSFAINQQDILDSVLRVTQTSREDWEITHEPSIDRYKEGVRAVKEGNWLGLTKVGYSRIFFAEGGGDFRQKGTLNEVLKLPQESIDEATRRAIERAEV